MTFPPLPEAVLKKLLEIPAPGSRVRVAVDTDFGNEIDDWFAVTCLMIHENVKLEAIYAAPFSFRARLMALLRANELIKTAPTNMTSSEEALVEKYRGQIEAIEAIGVNPCSLLHDGSHVALTPAQGMEQSYRLLLDFVKMFGGESVPVLRGAQRYIEDGCPVRCDAVEHMIELARNGTTDDPLYIIAIAAPTNVASALLLAPDIRDKVVVVWDAGYPSNVVDLQESSFNLEQDMFASRLLFSSGVPLVYVPGFYIAQQLTLSEADVTAWFKESGRIGRALYKRYRKNPLFQWYGKHASNLIGQTWNIWDLANAAWIVNPSAMSSRIVPAPVLTEDLYWHPEQKHTHIMRECYYAHYNSVFPDFIERLRKYESSSQCSQSPR